MEPKYFVRFKTSEGDHISSQTMSQEEYLNLLEDTLFLVINGITNTTTHPSIYFEVEKRELQYQPYAENQR